ncbi:MAG: hypothetical protein KC505_00630 [Myxococcales bacterium]|nr:hypothetical protein [Myxococcales bacterium]USN51454.1 MAG: hypothetical protein H6731_03335 [Myxococcales bacterium]
MMVIVFVVVVALALMAIVSLWQAANKDKKLLRQAQEKTLLLEEKIGDSRKELKKSKEELERAKTALVEARELTKKKLRRQKEHDHHSNNDKEAVMTEKIMNEDNDKALSALESQIEQLKKEQEQSEELIRAQCEQELNKKLEAAHSESDELKKKVNELQEEVKKQKRLLRPEGNKIDLKTLPDEAAGEFARLYRKTEQLERLHGAARAKLLLAQEKFTDLQKRYFSVCRELAVSAGNDENIDLKEARDVAEKIVVKHEQENGDQAPNPAENQN